MGEDKMKSVLIRRPHTPETIEELKPNEVFVFGSNLAGRHIGGAARVAYEKFGATMGQGIGFSGRSYAIPTLNEEFKKVEPCDLVRHIKNFLEFALSYPEKTFWVTKIGTGIAGWSMDDVRRLFWEAVKETFGEDKGTQNYNTPLPLNIRIPEEFEYFGKELENQE